MDPEGVGGEGGVRLSVLIFHRKGQWVASKIGNQETTV